MNEIINNTLNDFAQKKESLLKECLPDKFEQRHLRCVVLPNDVLIYKYHNVPVLEVHPMEFEEPEYKDDKIIMRVNMNFRKL